MLVGRDAECRALDEIMARTRLGHGGALLLVGEPGIGKTSLLTHVVEHADGMSVRQVAGVPAERGVPFGALSVALAAADPDLKQLPGPQASALRVALARQEGPAPGRFVVGAATLGVLVGQAELSPLVIVLDDAHDMDAPSAHAITFAARRLVADPVLVVAALREHERSPLREAGLPELAVRGLDRDAAAALLTSVGGQGHAADRVDRLHRSTGGNPLALLELSRSGLPPEGPQGVPGVAPLSIPAVLTDSFVRRANEAGPDTARLLAVIDVSGGDLALVLRALPSLDVDGPAAVAAAEAADLVAVSGDRLAVTHPLAASAAYASLLPEARRAVHRAVAGALPDSDDGRRAWHLASAAVGPDPQVAGALAVAAEDAARRGAYAVAAAAFERSAQLTDGDLLLRADRSLHAGAAAFDAGELAAATRLLDGVEVEQLPGALACRHGELRGHIGALCGNLPESWSILMSTARGCGDEDRGRAVRLTAEAAHAAFYAMDGNQMRQAALLLNEFLERGLDDHGRGLARIGLGITAVLDGRDGAAALHEGVDLLGQAGGPVDERAAVSLMLGLLFLRREGHSRRLREVVDRARESISIGALPHLLFLLARDEATSDRWSAAAADYAEGASLADELGQSMPAAMSLAGLAWLDARRGEENDCRVHASAARQLAERGQIRLATVWVDSALAELSLVQGQVQAAADRYAQLADRLERSSVHDVDISPAPELVEALVRQGRRAEAQSVADRHRRRAQEKGGPWSLARSLRTHGLLVGDDAIDLMFCAALEEHAKTTDMFETARTRLAYGARLRRARRRVEARRQLSAAHEDFAVAGARPWAQLAAEELEASGASVIHSSTPAPVPLTPRELQIVRLMAEGRTTREAAAALFVSPKTVEYHLRNVYTRLGVSTRAEMLERIGAP